MVLFALFSVALAQKPANTTEMDNSSSNNSTSAGPPPSLCTSYPDNGICHGFINYSVFTKGAPVAMIEQQLGQLVNMSKLLGHVAPSCVDAYYRYSCSLAYPKCGENAAAAPKMGCQQACQDVHYECTNIFMLTGKGALPDCNKKSPLTRQRLSSDASTCNAIAPQIEDPHAFYNLSALTPGFIMDACPSPFLKDPNAKPGLVDQNNNIYCRAGCCIPCPAQNYFYPEGWAVHGFLATDILRFISSIVSFFMLVSYLVLPDKRRHPSLLILNVSASIFLFSFVVYFSIGNPQRLQCANAVAVSTQDNNALCATQGAILIFASLATCCWSAALILNLHMHTVWNSNFFTNRYFILNILCWGYPAVIMAVSVGLHQVKFEFANLCLVAVDRIFELFFYPMAAIVCPAFVVHIATFVYITKIAIQEGVQSDMSQSLSRGSMAGHSPARRHKHVITAVQIQWRALLLAILSSGTVIFYWIFYFTQIHRVVSLERDQSITNHWLECMLSPGGHQNSCVTIIRDHLPPYGLMMAAETLVSTQGIWLFVIFGKRSLWREWNDLIYDLRISFGNRGRMEKNGEQFFAL
ncbi:uncharacterized protein ATC70_010293 [Mucor velutinosus]|uniref:G-protein coupled receptors family 2 profile 2 domain-containing protein n=1 Tax=Mucor velutinosus TaxID=708070 RepID=A0AAN7DEE3_9FUNG|nr:hypothetical protein ATC70_010293 [Mucor velutinosus]